MHTSIIETVRQELFARTKLQSKEQGIANDLLNIAHLLYAGEEVRQELKRLQLAHLKHSSALARVSRNFTHMEELQLQGVVQAMRSLSQSSVDRERCIEALLEAALDVGDKNSVHKAINLADALINPVSHNDFSDLLRAELHEVLHPAPISSALMDEIFRDTPSMASMSRDNAPADVPTSEEAPTGYTAYGFGITNIEVPVAEPAPTTDGTAARAKSEEVSLGYTAYGFGIPDMEPPAAEPASMTEESAARPIDFIMVDLPFTASPNEEPAQAEPEPESQPRAKEAPRKAKPSDPLGEIGESLSQLLEYPQRIIGRRLSRLLRESLDPADPVHRRPSK